MLELSSTGYTVFLERGCVCGRGVVAGQAFVEVLA